MSLKTVGVAALAAAFAAGCAETGTSSETRMSAAPAQPEAPAQTENFTDAQLRAYVAAAHEIEPIQERFASMSEQQRTEAATQIRAIQARHSINAVTYNAIQNRMHTDPAFASRVAELQVANLSDAQVEAFAEASLEIAPLAQDLAGATPEQRAQLAESIGDVLRRHDLDGATYNAIARRAQSDETLAARISRAQAEAQNSES